MVDEHSVRKRSHSDGEQEGARKRPARRVECKSGGRFQEPLSGAIAVQGQSSQQNPTSVGGEQNPQKSSIAVKKNHGSGQAPVTEAGPARKQTEKSKTDSSKLLRPKAIAGQFHNSATQTSEEKNRLDKSLAEAKATIREMRCERRVKNNQIQEMEKSGERLGDELEQAKEQILEKEESERAWIEKDKERKGKIREMQAELRERKKAEKKAKEELETAKDQILEKEESERAWIEKDKERKGKIREMQAELRERKRKAKEELETAKDQILEKEESGRASIEKSKEMEAKLHKVQAELHKVQAELHKVQAELHKVQAELRERGGRPATRLDTEEKSEKRMTEESNDAEKHTGRTESEEMRNGAAMELRERNPGTYQTSALGLGTRRDDVDQVNTRFVDMNLDPMNLDV